MMGSEMDTAAQRERYSLQGVPVGLISSRPGASGERSRTQRSVTAHKAAGDKIFPAIWVVPRSFFKQPSSLFGAGLFFVFRLS